MNSIQQAAERSIKILSEKLGDTPDIKLALEAIYADALSLGMLQFDTQDAIEYIVNVKERLIALNKELSNDQAEITRVFQKRVLKSDGPEYTTDNS